MDLQRAGMTRPCNQCCRNAGGRMTRGVSPSHQGKGLGGPCLTGRQPLSCAKEQVAGRRRLYLPSALSAKTPNPQATRATQGLLCSLPQPAAPSSSVQRPLSPHQPQRALPLSLRCPSSCAAPAGARPAHAGVGGAPHRAATILAASLTGRQLYSRGSMGWILGWVARYVPAQRARMGASRRGGRGMEGLPACAKKCGLLGPSQWVSGQAPGHPGSCPPASACHCRAAHCGAERGPARKQY